MTQFKKLKSVNQIHKLKQMIKILICMMKFFLLQKVIIKFIILVIDLYFLGFDSNVNEEIETLEAFA